MATTLPSHVRRILKNENVKFSAHQNKYFIYFWGDFFFHQETNSSCACPCLTVCSPFCLLLPSAWLVFAMFYTFYCFSVFFFVIFCLFLYITYGEDPAINPTIFCQTHRLWHFALLFAFFTHCVFWFIGSPPRWLNFTPFCNRFQ